MKVLDYSTDWLSRFRRKLGSLGGEKASVISLAVLIAYAACRSLVGAATTPFTYDEACTSIVAQQPGVSGIWRALERAADSQAPGFYLVERISAAIIPNQEVAFRLPSILGFCCILICVFVFARRRSSGAYALMGAVIGLMTVLFHWYGVEARPYSLVVACVSVGLVCYQRAPAAGWVVLMGFVLAVAQTLSHYAVFALVPFGIAEVVLALTTRRFRLGVWMALVCGAAPLAFFWPLLVQFKKYYVTLPFVRPSLSGIIHTYGSLLSVPPPWGVAVFAALSLGLLEIISSFVLTQRAKENGASISLHEHVALLVLLGLPLVGYAVAKLTHAGMTDRYVLSAALGVPLSAGQLLSKSNRRSIIVALGFLIPLVAVQEASFWISRRGQFIRFASPVASIESLVKSAGYSDLPVVVSDGLEYLPIMHYVKPPEGRRFVSVVDLSASIAFAGDDTLDKELLVLRDFAPLQVLEFSAFAAGHHSFLLYSTNGSHGDPHDWWVDRLVRDGYIVRVIAAKNRQSVFLVTSPQQSY